MSLAMISGLAVVMLGTAFLSGIFGMAGGMILMGVLLAVLPVPAAMALHAVTQMASNAWRAVLWHRYVRWRPVAFFLVGNCAALAVWSVFRWVPEKSVALIVLGLTPFMFRLIPKSVQPSPLNPVHGAGMGAVCMSLMLVCGVSGPLLDTFFLGGGMERRQIVATKAVCQVAGHFSKLLYFGAMVADAAALDPLMLGLAVAASIAGTSAARRILEAMTDHQFRTWANRVITVIALYYLGQGVWLLAV
jgi:uncharacterized membrane protein YfcA